MSFDAILAELQAHRRLIEVLADDLAELSVRVLKPSDQRDLAALLPIADRLFPHSSLTAAELVVKAVNLDGADGDALRALVDRYTDARGEARPLGKLLARCAGCSVGGLRLIRLSAPDGARDADGAVYAVRSARVCV